MIDSFSGNFRWLSNFYPCSVEYEGIKYPSSEHAFVAAKTEDREERIIIANLETAGDAKKYGRNMHLRDNWNAIRIEEMTNIVYAKFSQNNWLKQKLLDTHPHELVEGNYWNDRFWGCDLAGNGANNLGKILMKLRNLWLVE